MKQGINGSSVDGLLAMIKGNFMTDKGVQDACLSFKLPADEQKAVVVVKTIAKALDEHRHDIAKEIIANFKNTNRAVVSQPKF